MAVDETKPVDADVEQASKDKKTRTTVGFTGTNRTGYKLQVGEFGNEHPSVLVPQLPSNGCPKSQEGFAEDPVPGAQIIWDLCYPSFRAIASTGMQNNGEAGVQSVLVGFMAMIAALLGGNVELRRELLVTGTSKYKGVVRSGPVEFVFASKAGNEAPGRLMLVIEAKADLTKDYALYVDQVCFEIRAAWESNKKLHPSHQTDAITGVLIDGAGGVVFRLDAAGTTITCSRYLSVFDGRHPAKDALIWLSSLLKGACPGYVGREEEWTKHRDKYLEALTKDTVNSEAMLTTFSKLRL